MNSGNPKSTIQQVFSVSNQPPQVNFNLNQTFTILQSHCSGFMENVSHFPLFNPSSFKTHLQNSICNLQNQTKRTIDTAISRFNPSHPSSSGKPLWARIPDHTKTQLESVLKPVASLSNESIEKRLAGVPVYALMNPNEELVLVTGAKTGKSLGLLCFKKEDAEALLMQMKSMDSEMRKAESKVVAVALNKVFQLKVDGVAFRLIPESSQVKNALKEKEKAGLYDDGFSGVPVFQSKSLALRSSDKCYRPLFFRKEDLDKSLVRASHQQNKLNPASREGDIQVAVFEEIIKGMKDSSNSTWDDVVFIPPGFDVSTDPVSLQEAANK